MTLVQAHRGLSDEHAENTVAAFQAARTAGFDCIELDLRLTHDKEVVVLHDASIARTTEGSGRVADLDYDELREHDTGEGPVPRLEGVVHALAGWDGMWNLEMKVWRAAAPALQLMRHHGLLGHCLVSSMEPRALEEARSHEPDVPRGLIVLGPPDEEDVQAALGLGCAWINIDHDFISADLVKQMAAAGLKVGAWTVDDPDEARGLVARGVASVITDSRAVLAALK